MLTLKKIWLWLLLKNPAGLAYLLTVCGIGLLYLLASFLGLIEGANIPLVLRYCGIAGALLFISMPLLSKLNK